MELNSSDHQLLGHHSNQSPSPSIAQFGQEASSEKNPGCFKPLPLRLTETTCFCDPLMNIFFSELFPRCVAWPKPVSELYRLFFCPQGLVFARYALSPFIKMCVPFQIIPIQLNLPQVSFTFSNTYEQYECSWAKFQLSQIRVWVLMQWNIYV